MTTLILQNQPRKASTGNSWRISVLGADGDAKDAMKESIRALEHHPAKASRRSILDMLSLIDTHKYEIKHTEHYYTDDDLEAWMFILQG